MKSLFRAIPIILLMFAIKNQHSEAGTDRYRSVHFYGHDLGFFYHPVMDEIHLASLEKQDIRLQLERMRGHQLNLLAQRISFSSEQFELDDIGKLMLVKKLSRQWLRHQSMNEQVLLEYAILRELHFDVLLSRTGERLNCFGRIDFTPRKYVYIYYNGRKYTHLNFEDAPNGLHHQILNDQEHDLRVIRAKRHQLPAVNARKTEKSLEFNWLGDTLLIPFTLNQSLIEYMYDLPDMPIGQSFVRNTLSAEVKNSLYPQLRLHMREMNRINQLRFLLAFVQQSIPYGSDFEKYGTDYFYYPEQSLNAANADCEDKAYLLATLAYDLLGMHSVALHFKKDEHLGLAFHIPGFHGGQTFNYEGKNYVPCEPTSSRPLLAYSAYDLSRIGGIVELI